MSVNPLWLIVLVIIVLILTCKRSENLEWENCAPCFNKCEDDQWSGKIPPHLGVTNKDVCAKKCAKLCRGYAYRWSDSIHVGFDKHGP